MSELRKTELNSIHRESGARMVDFGGWDMPVNYGSQLEEHRAVRSAAGMFDVSHMRVVDVSGDAARAFLRRALANSVDKLQSAGRALYTCMLNSAGGVIDDLIVYYFDERWFRLVVNAATADKDIAWLGQLNAEGQFQVQIEPRTEMGIIAVQGPAARATVGRVLPAAQARLEALKPFEATLIEDGTDSPYGALTIARTGYTGEDGVEIIVPLDHIAALWRALAEAGVRPCGLGARDTLRLEAGLNLYGQDMDETVSPLDAGLAWTVDFSEGRDFIGRTALEAAGSRWQFVGLILRDGGGVLRQHQTVKTAAGDGEVTSGTYSPTLQRSIALARLPREVAPGDAVQVVIRNKLLDASVVKLPFVRLGKIRVSL